MRCFTCYCLTLTRSNELEVLEYCLCLNVHSFKSKVDNETIPVFLQVENEDGSAGKPDLGFGFDKKKSSFNVSISPQACAGGEGGNSSREKERSCDLTIIVVRLWFFIL